MSEPQHNLWRSAALVSAIGIDLAVCLMAGYFLGAWLSSWLGGGPAWVIFGIATGLAVGIGSVVLILRQALKEDRNG